MSAVKNEIFKKSSIIPIIKADYEKSLHDIIDINSVDKQTLEDMTSIVGKTLSVIPLGTEEKFCTDFDELFKEQYGLIAYKNRDEFSTNLNCFLNRLTIHEDRGLILYKEENSLRIVNELSEFSFITTNTILKGFISCDPCSIIINSSHTFDLLGILGYFSLVKNFYMSRV